MAPILGALRAALPAAKPSILALDLELLGDDPLAQAKRLADESRAEMVLLLHRFALRETIREIARATGAAGEGAYCSRRCAPT